VSVDAAQGTGAGREPRGRSACELRGIVVTPAQRIADGAVRWEGDSLTYVGPRQGKPAAAAEPSDLPYIVPGFVDLHVHGGGGRDTMEGSDDALAEISKTHLQGGTTSLLATTLTAPIEQIEEALEAVEQCIQERQAETTVVGAHIEGPYFNASQAGAQNSEHLREPASTDYLPLLERFSCIRRFSAAPELKGALALGRELRRRGVLASIAHTDATYTQVRRAIEAGYSHVTHIYSAMSSVRRRNAYRIAGVVEAALLEESLSVEVIADGHHLPPSLLRLVIRCKGPGKVCAVTDAISAAGLGPGSYQLGGLDVVVDGLHPLRVEHLDVKKTVEGDESFLQVIGVILIPDGHVDAPEQVIGAQGMAFGKEIGPQSAGVGQLKPTQP